MLHSLAFASSETVDYILSRVDVAALINERDHYNEDDQWCVCLIDDDVLRTMYADLPQIPAGEMDNTSSDSDPEETETAKSYIRWAVVKLDRNQVARNWATDKTWQELRVRNHSITIKFGREGDELGLIEQSQLDLEKAKAGCRSMLPHRSPLHIAVTAGNIELVRKLLDKGADMDQRDWFGMTPQDIAAKHGYKDIVELLRSRRADKT